MFVLKGGVRQGVLEVGEVTLDDVVTLIVRGKDREAAQPPDVQYKSFG